MTYRSKIAALVLALTVSLPMAAGAQQVVFSTPQGAPQTVVATYSQEQIDQMVAPIALYPDPLVSQILMASTYPLEIVEASRWMQAPGNAQLSGPALGSALEQQPWDPSVKSIVSVPEVLSMMDQNLQWTEQLGNAFLGQQPVVMDSIQHLRQMAQATGNLQSTPYQTVVPQQGYIAIQPVNPQVVYVPVYNPQVVYGPWPYAGYPPYYFPPPRGFVYASTGVISFGIGVGIVTALWGWDHWDWGHHRIVIDDHRYAAINHGRPPPVAGHWTHDPSHRWGTYYPNPRVRSQFGGNAPRGTNAQTHTARASVQPQNQAQHVGIQDQQHLQSQAREHQSQIMRTQQAAPRAVQQPAVQPQPNLPSQAREHQSQIMHGPQNQQQNFQAPQPAAAPVRQSNTQRPSRNADGNYAPRAQQPHKPAPQQQHEEHPQGGNEGDHSGDRGDHGGGQEQQHDR